MITTYTWTMLWHERQRYLPAVLAVSFSALLVTVQCGLLLGMFNFASLPVDHTPLADVWVGGPSIVSVDAGRPISEIYLSRLASQPEIASCEIFFQHFNHWIKPDGGFELCMIIGSRLEDPALGAMQELTPEMRTLLSEPGTVVIDESDLDRLGIAGVGGVAQIADHRVRVVGVVRGFRGMAGAYVFCSVETARALLHFSPQQTIYVIGHCYDPADAPTVVKNLRAEFPEVSAFTREELSLQSRLHWLIKTKAGLALGYAAALGLVVGAVVTSQTLYSATAASLREYAVLWALGIPVWKMSAMVLNQSLWVGMIGIVLAMPLIYVLAHAADWLGLTVALPYWLVGSAVVVTLLMTLVSGLLALRLFWGMEAAELLR